MNNIFITLATLFVLFIPLGWLLEKIRIPAIFAALLVGLFLALKNPFLDVISSDNFELLADLGMYMLMFLVGIEIDIAKLIKKGSFIFRSTFIIISLEAIFGSLVVHYVFGYSWVLSFLVSMSFATVGEAILIPILDEFNMINTNLGNAIIGIGSVDDLLEIALLLTVTFFVGHQEGLHLMTVLLLVLLLVVITTVSVLVGKKVTFNSQKTGQLIVFVLAVLFCYLTIGYLIESQPMSALLAGITVRVFIPSDKLESIINFVKNISYGFLGPIFFVSVGASVHFEYLFYSPLLIILVVLVSKFAKIAGSLLAGFRELGVKQSIVMGVALSVRFSTSIVIIKYLFDNQVIDAKLFTIIIASSIVFKFIVPVLLSILITKWKLEGKHTVAVVR